MGCTKWWGGHSPGDPNFGGKEDHLFGPLGMSRGPHVAISGGENLVGTPGETTWGRGPEVYCGPVPTL